MEPDALLYKEIARYDQLSLEWVSSGGSKKPSESYFLGFLFFFDLKVQLWEDLYVLCFCGFIASQIRGCASSALGLPSDPSSSIFLGFCRPCLIGRLQK